MKQQLFNSSLESAIADNVKIAICYDDISKVANLNEQFYQMTENSDRISPSLFHESLTDSNEIYATAIVKMDDAIWAEYKQEFDEQTKI